MRTYRFTLAEDDETELFLLHHTISQAFPRSSISTFTNAEDALRHIVETGTDILITDHGMGKMSGTELICDLRKRGLRLPIIMISGSPHAEEEAREAGATEFLQKKANSSEIQEHIRRLLPE
jgi:DNA-binding NtrC family response regulator